MGHALIKPKGQTSGTTGANMAKDWQIKKRRPVRRKNIAPLLKDLESALGIDLAVDGAFLEMADYGPWKMVLVDRVPLAVELMSPDDERVVFLTLRGFLSYPCEKRFVEVDHGAIPFLMKGADCMVAGIHGADEEIKEGDLVWVRDQTHKRPLAIGWATKDGPSLIGELKGKGLKNIHWVGDELWEMEL
jgi:PUA domain protein|tara:strand:- start:10 stop:576 length:567 start_codon:yes stop_codon:yes gene_type:complete